MKQIIDCIILFCLVFQLNAQTEAQKAMLEHYNDSLIELRKEMLKAKTSESRIAANENFTKTFKSILSQEISYQYSFDSVPSIGDLRSPDGSFRLLTWNLPFNDGTHEYYCFVQTKTSKKKNKQKVDDIQLIQLLDKSESISKEDKKVLGDDNWYGALYYEIIPIKSGGKIYYTLLGWDGNDQYTSKKIIDVMYFSGGQIKFGANIFKLPKGNKKRIVFEHSADATMSVRYEKKQKAIIFDHLSPLREDLSGIKQYYVPDMSFDAFVLEKGKWVFVADFDARNKENILMPYTAPE